MRFIYRHDDGTIEMIVVSEASRFVEWCLFSHLSNVAGLCKSSHCAPTGRAMRAPEGHRGTSAGSAAMANFVWGGPSKYNTHRQAD